MLNLNTSGVRFKGWINNPKSGDIHVERHHDHETITGLRDQLLPLKDDHIPPGLIEHRQKNGHPYYVLKVNVAGQPPKADDYIVIKDVSAHRDGTRLNLSIPVASPGSRYYIDTDQSQIETDLLTELVDLLKQLLKNYRKTLH